jgi:DNA-binding NarL/FixJ family response regulator
MSQMRKPTVNHEGGSQKMSYETLRVEKPNKKFPNVTVTQLRLGMGEHKLKFQDDELILLHKEGLTDRELAKELNVTKTTIFHRRKKLGLQPNLKSFESAIKWVATP